MNEKISGLKDAIRPRSQINTESVLRFSFACNADLIRTMREGTPSTTKTEYWTRSPNSWSTLDTRERRLSSGMSYAMRYRAHPI